MAFPRTYARYVIDFLAVLFVVSAIFHETQKAGLPTEFASTESIVLDGVPLASGNEIEFALSAYRIGDLVQVAPAPGSPPVAVQLVPYYNWPLVALDAFMAIILIGLGLFVSVYGPDAEGANVFHLGSLTIAMALTGTRTIYAMQPPWFGMLLCIIFFLAYTNLPAVFAHFTLVFPAIRLKNYRRIVAALYAAGCAIAVWSGWEYLRAVDGRSVGLLRQFLAGSMVQNGFAVLLIVAGILNFSSTYRQTATAADRRKLRWVFYGLLIGPAPFVFLWALPEALGSTPWVAEWLFKLFLLLIPVTFAISIVRYRVMDIDLLINRSLVYGVVIGAGGVAYALLLVWAANALTSYTHEASIIVLTCAAALFAVGFDPARRRVQAFVDRRFFRVQYSFRESLRSITDRLKKSLEVRQVARALVERIDQVLPVERIGFFTLRQPGYRIQVLEQQGFDLLVAHGARFEVENLRSKLNLPVGLDGQIEPGVVHEPADAGVFRRWGLALVFPILSEAKEILGFMVLGPKKSGVRFTVEDVDLLAAAAAEAGMAIERISLQEKLLLEHAEAKRLDELNRLKSYFVSSVSHDLKTPLTSIRMFAELLRDRTGCLARSGQ